MHDWTMRQIVLEWQTGHLTIDLVGTDGNNQQLTAEEVVNLQIPRIHEWGPSVSVNNVAPPRLQGDGLSHLEIEMQSGDVISIVARRFALPID